ncbi:hypothetical protein [Actinorugispora endophytica]|uniref:Uncharacterized protein n=1 Tax=Actinorugispora endophytica TaxID=1605990 RepID=A0A4R6V7E1_9ACTN|nr:hypothetical protein [Actinorugispora endophytica]TDQ52213.1 hypothetical protein EV190_10743 [Actinorugispora endophytica]
MEWSSRGERAPRLTGDARARAASAVRRLVVAGGFALAAWALGSAAPACADALDSITETTQAVTGAPTGHRTAGPGLPAVAEAAESVVDGTRTVTADAVPVPTVAERIPEPDLRVLPDARVLPSEPAPGEHGRVAVPDGDESVPAAVTVPDPEPAAAPAGRHDVPGGKRTGSAHHVPDTGATAEDPADTGTGAGSLPGVPDRAPAKSVPPNSAPGQAPAFTGVFVGYLTHLPAAPGPAAPASLTGHAPALVPQQHADEHFSFPD